MNFLKTFFAIIIGTSLSPIISGQKFAPVNAKWHFQKYCVSPPWMTNCGYFTVEAVRDTTINSKPATIIENRNLETLIPGAEMIIREDSNKVCFFENNRFKLLYDFNLHTGDTLTFSVPYKGFYYDFTCGQGADTSKFAQVVIDSTAQLVIDGQLLKSLYTSPVYNNDTAHYYSWNLGQIVERIGSYNGIFGCSTTQCLGGFPGNIRCYNDSSINYKAVTIDCDFFSAINEIVNENTLSVLPNPSNGCFTIQSNAASQKYRLFVNSIQGRLLVSENIIIDYAYHLDLTNLANGIYFLSLQSDKEQLTRKIVVQH